MKKTIAPTLFFAAALIAAANLTAQAQAKPASPPRYTDLVGDNPTTEADLQTVGSYLSLITAGNTEKAKLLLADTYRGYGPAAADSATRDQAMTGWQQRYKTQADRKMRLEGQTTFRVKSGRRLGNWVATWGEYSFTQNGKTIRAPFQYMAHVTKGKIDVDRTYVDNLSIVQAQGYKLTPPAAAAAAK